MASSDLEQLIDMGFDKGRAELAIHRTTGLHEALDWLEKYQDPALDKIVPSRECATADPIIAHEAQELTSTEDAKSLMCNDCGRRLRSHAQAEFHATKTGHVDFAESTEEIAPLTDAEKKQKLEELKAKAAAKKAAGSMEERAARKRNEEIRRKSTKETSDLKEELRQKEQLKEAAAKRKEKLADMDAKKRIQARIAADREERRMKSENEKLDHRDYNATGKPLADTSTVPVYAAIDAMSTKSASTYTETRLRLQVATAGVTLQKTFSAATNLFEVAAVVKSETGVTVSSFMQSYPRKGFNQADFGVSLRDLGLVPSAVLITQQNGCKHMA